MARQRRKRIICANCNQQLKDEMNYCFNCGQENHIKRVSLKMILSDFTATYFSFESKLFVSLKYLLTRPSFLSSEYLNGKMESYLKPIRMYIFISFTFFLFNGLVGEKAAIGDLNLQKDGEPIAVEAVQEELQKELQEEGVSTTGDEALFASADEVFNGKFKKILANNRELNAFKEFVMSKLPWLLFFLIPVLGSWFFLFFYRKKYFYVDHLVFVLHLQSFLFVLLIVSTLLNVIFSIDVTALMFLCFLIYGYIASKRFYNRGKISTFIRLVLIGSVHLVVSTLFGLVFLYLTINSYNI